LRPITTDSNQHDTTLTSIQRILVDSSKSIDAVATSLISLPISLLSLASTKEQQHASTSYLLSLLKSLDFDIVTRHCQSSKKSIKVAAYLSLARLNQMYAAASLTTSEDDPNANEQLQLQAFLWKKLNPTIRGIDLVLLNMPSFDESTSKLLCQGVSLPLSLSAFKLDLDQSPRVFLSTHVYLRSTLSTVSNSTLQSFGGFEFLRNREHYSNFSQIAHALHQDSECDPNTLASIPLPVWVLLMPFVAPQSVAKRVTESIGLTLLGSQCRVFCTLFMSKDEIKSEAVTKMRAVGAAKAFFREIEYLLIRFFRLPRALIITFDDEEADNDEATNDLMGLDLAVCLFRSLCLYSPLETATGVQLFQQSLLRLIRIWVGGTGSKYSADSDTSSFNAASDAIKSIFRGKVQSHEVLSCSDFAASVLREFFLPAVKHSIPWSRYQLLVEFIESCFLPNTQTQGLPMHGLDVPNNIEVIGFIDKIYPGVMASMIFNQDLEGLSMCTAFRMYLVNENRRQKRFQKKSGNEYFVGKLVERNRSASFARDLVAGVKSHGSAVSAKTLTENMKMLCWKSDVIEYILPKLLLHSERSVLKFFADLCPPNASLSQILQEKELTVLKQLVWELGADDADEDKAEEIYSTLSSEKGATRNSVVLALKMGYLIKEGHFLMSASERSINDDTSARSWIGSNFMYLLVNVVLYRWKSRSPQEKFQTIKCLRAMLRFLPPADSLQFMPQIMVAISNAMSSSEASTESEEGQRTKLRFVAVATLFDFVKILGAHRMSNVAENLVSLVVILFPLFEKKSSHCDIAREEAVNLLEWLAENASKSFSGYHFYP
jgi:hypothetical protein